MIAKAVFVFCAQAILAQCISSQCIGAGYNGIVADNLGWGPALPYVPEVPLAASWVPIPCGPGYGPASLAGSNGGGFAINSVSPIGITGISMTSENAYEGPLSVTGTVPFLGAVVVEGALPSVGAGAVAYGCGNGNVAMLSEDITAAPYAVPYGYGPAIAATDYGYGYAPVVYEADIIGPAYGYGYNIGCGCGYY